MKKVFIGAIIGVAIIVGGIYILTPNSSTQSNKNNQYVGLESKTAVAKATVDTTNTNNNANLPQGVTVTLSAQAEQSGNANYFESAIKNKYMGDGSVQIYISQVTGALGGPMRAIYDVDINGKEELGLTATRTVTTQGYGTNITTTPIIFASAGVNN